MVRVFGVHYSINVVLKHFEQTLRLLLHQTHHSLHQQVIMIFLVENLIYDPDYMWPLSLYTLLNHVKIRKPDITFFVEENKKFLSHLLLYCAQKDEVLNVLFEFVVSFLRVEHSFFVIEHSLQNIIICEKLDVKAFKFRCFEPYDFVVSLCIRHSKFILKDLQREHV